MAENILILVAIIAIVYLVLKKFTVYRCPKCSSTSITALHGHDRNDNKTIYVCSRCKTMFTRKKEIIVSGSDIGSRQQG